MQLTMGLLNLNHRACIGWLIQLIGGKITVAYHIESIGSYRDHKADSGITIKMTDE